MAGKFITYEQPLNEHIRLCLRLEHLFKQLRNQLRVGSEHNSRAALETLLKIVDVADRPDLKSKLLQTLGQQTTTLAQLAQFPHVDSEKLQDILNHLDHLIRGLHQHANSKLGEPLRQNNFLKMIRLQLSNPAGACSFNVPAYALWLHQSEEKRFSDLTHWSKQFDLLKDIVTTILSLTRDSTPPQNVSAENAFYQQALDANLPCQLLRITLPVDYNLYPEISVGKHRLSVRFKGLVTACDETDSRAKTNFPFQLSCCRV